MDAKLIQPSLRKTEKQQLTAVWLYFLFGGDSALFNISAIMNGSSSIEILCFKSPHKKHRQAAKRYGQAEKIQLDNKNVILQFKNK
jgi:hypothetical protein